MLDMRLFARGTFTGALLVNLLSVVALVGFLFFVAQHLQLIVGLSPMQAGFALVPGMVAMIVSGLVVVPIASRVNARIVVPAALAFSVAGYVLVALSATDADLGLLVAAFALLGLGIGAAETVSNDLILSSAPPEKAGAASAVSETAYELGAVLGTAVLGGILTSLFRTGMTLPPEVTGSAADAARETLAGAMAVAEQLGGALGDQVRLAAAHAFDSGVVVTSLVGAGLVVAAAVIAAATLSTRPHTSEESDVACHQIGTDPR